MKATAPEPEEGEGQGKGRHKKKKGKAADKDASEDPAPAEAEPALPSEPAAPVLVLHDIRTLNTAEGPYVVVSAVGFVVFSLYIVLAVYRTVSRCSALLAFPFSSTEPLSASSIVTFDCERPVLDFTIQDQHILVSTHGVWSDGAAGAASTPLPHIRKLTLSSQQVSSYEPRVSQPQLISHTVRRRPASLQIVLFTEYERLNLW